MTTPEPPYEGAQADIAGLIDELVQLVGESRRVPFSRNILVDEERFLDLVELLRETVPLEIRQAQRVVRERERIIGDAQQEAAKILATARQRGEYWASDEGILNEARQRSEELLRRSDEERRRNVGEIEMFAYKRLTAFEEAIREGFLIIEDSMREAVARLDEAIEQARSDDERPV
jgi:vacuolar-type H+-ATPase subunit H